MKVIHVRRQQDFWTALVVIATSIFFLYKTSEIPFFKADAAGVDAGQWYNSAALVPYGIFASILVLGLALMVTAIRQGGSPSRTQFEPVLRWLISSERMMAVAIIMLCYIFALIPRVDFILSSALVVLALIYGFHETRARATILAMLAVLVASAYAMVMHFPQSEWSMPHDDDWVTLIAFVLLVFIMFIEIRMSGERPDRYIRLAPAIALFVPFFLIAAMAFGFRQNVPNRTGLLFKQIEYHYYVSIKPWLGKKG